uniref:Uncharacterized protein n=1 Tax=Ditylenchus dipsaci TaxID=166011 RepID=A0A915DZT9_9BILA
MIQQLTPPPPLTVPAATLPPTPASNLLIDDNITIVDAFFHGLTVIVLIYAVYFMNQYLKLQKLDIFSANEMVSSIKKQGLRKKEANE